jgi:hypothetical protein
VEEEAARQTREKENHRNGGRKSGSLERLRTRRNCKLTCCGGVAKSLDQFEYEMQHQWFLKTLNECFAEMASALRTFSALIRIEP